MLAVALLGFLSRAPMSGYDLEQAINASLQHFWPVHLSQVYRTLKQLEADGQLTSQLHPQVGRPDRRVYEVTDAGRARLAEWDAQLYTKHEAMRQPFMLRFFFGATRDRAQTLAELALQRQHWSAELAELHSNVAAEIAVAEVSPEAEPDDGFFWTASRLAGEKVIGAFIEWIDETTAQLQSRPASGNSVGAGSVEEPGPVEQPGPVQKQGASDAEPA